MTLEEARELVNGPLWTAVRDDFLRTGEFQVYPLNDARRLEYLPRDLRAEIERWLAAIPMLETWRTVVDGNEVRRLKAEHPGVYPEAMRYAPYFAGKKDVLPILLKVKFPEAYATCCS